MASNDDYIVLIKDAKTNKEVGRVLLDYLGRWLSDCGVFLVKSDALKGWLADDGLAEKFSGFENSQLKRGLARTIEKIIQNGSFYTGPLREELYQKDALPDLAFAKGMMISIFPISISGKVNMLAFGFSRHSLDPTTYTAIIKATVFAGRRFGEMILEKKKAALATEPPKIGEAKDEPEAKPAETRLAVEAESVPVSPTVDMRENKSELRGVMTLQPDELVSKGRAVTTVAPKEKEKIIPEKEFLPPEEILAKPPAKPDANEDKLANVVKEPGKNIQIELELAPEGISAPPPQPIAPALQASERPKIEVADSVPVEPRIKREPSIAKQASQTMPMSIIEATVSSPIPEDLASGKEPITKIERARIQSPASRSWPPVPIAGEAAKNVEPQSVIEPAPQPSAVIAVPSRTEVAARKDEPVFESGYAPPLDLGTPSDAAIELESDEPAPAPDAPTSSDFAAPSENIVLNPTIELAPAASKAVVAFLNEKADEKEPAGREVFKDWSAAFAKAKKAKTAASTVSSSAKPDKPETQAYTPIDPPKSRWSQTVPQFDRPSPSMYETPAEGLSEGAAEQTAEVHTIEINADDISAVTENPLNKPAPDERTFYEKLRQNYISDDLRNAGSRRKTNINWGGHIPFNQIVKDQARFLKERYGSLDKVPIHCFRDEQFLNHASNLNQFEIDNVFAEMFASSDPFDRFYAAYACSIIRNPQSTQFLIIMLDDKTSADAEMASLALMSRRNDQKYKEFRDAQLFALDSDDEPKRRDAIARLGAAREEMAARPLAVLLQKNVETKAVMSALTRITCHAPSSERDGWIEWWNSRQDSSQTEWFISAIARSSRELALAAQSCLLALYGKAVEFCDMQTIQSRQVAHERWTAWNANRRKTVRLP